MTGFNTCLHKCLPVCVQIENNSPYGRFVEKTKEKQKGFFKTGRNHTFEFLLLFGIFITSVPETTDTPCIDSPCVLTKTEGQDGQAGAREIVLVPVSEVSATHRF